MVEPLLERFGFGEKPRRKDSLPLWRMRSTSRDVTNEESSGCYSVVTTERRWKVATAVELLVSRVWMPSEIQSEASEMYGIVEQTAGSTEYNPITRCEKRMLAQDDDDVDYLVVCRTRARKLD